MPRPTRPPIDGSRRRVARPRRPRPIWLAAIAATVVGCAEDTGRPPGGPNVVLVLIDTLRADALGAYGNPLDPSPELDRLAADGLLFERVIAPASWTKPSVASMLTGRLPRTLGVYDEAGDALRPGFATLAEYLSGAGYRTLGVTANPMINSVFAFDQGFDVYVDSVSPDTLEVGVTGGRLATARMVFDRALKLVDAADDRPVYLQLNVMDVHEHWRGAGSMTRDEYRDLFPGVDGAEYLQAVRQVSAEVAEFLDRLRTRPGFEDTLVIVVSDHGEGLNSHPGVAESRFHGAVLYESNTRVPWFMRHDGGSLPRKRVRRAVGLVDLTPTVLDYLGIAAEEGLDGESAMPMARGEVPRDAPPRPLVSETYYREYRKQAVFVEGWNYYRNLDDHPGLPKRELQAAGAPEHGGASDQAGEHPRITRDLATLLDRWDATHPRAAAMRAAEDMPPEMRAQLEAIGYLGGGRDGGGDGH